MMSVTGSCGVRLQSLCCYYKDDETSKYGGQENPVKRNKDDIG